MISKIVASAKWWSTGRVARHQLAEPVEQMLEPEHRADALVERVFVEDQGGLRLPAGDRRAEARDCSTAVQRGRPLASARAERHSCQSAATSAASCSERDAVVVDHGVGDRRAAPRAAPAARSRARTRSASSPSAATTRSICVASAQSTTSTRSTRARQLTAIRPAAARRTRRPGCRGSRGQRARLGADQRVQDGFEAALRASASANASVAHARAVERCRRRR